MGDVLQRGQEHRYTTEVLAEAPPLHTQGSRPGRADWGH